MRIGSVTLASLAAFLAGTAVGAGRQAQPTPPEPARPTELEWLLGALPKYATLEYGERRVKMTLEGAQITNCHMAWKELSSVQGFGAVAEYRLSLRYLKGQTTIAKRADGTFLLGIDSLPGIAAIYVRLFPGPGVTGDSRTEWHDRHTIVLGGTDKEAERISSAFDSAIRLCRRPAER